MVESFFYEAIIPFIREKGLSWVLPLHETVLISPPPISPICRTPRFPISQNLILVLGRNVPRGSYLLGRLQLYPHRIHKDCHRHRNVCRRLPRVPTPPRRESRQVLQVEQTSRTNKPRTGLSHKSHTQVSHASLTHQSHTQVSHKPHSRLTYSLPSHLSHLILPICHTS